MLRDARRRTITVTCAVHNVCGYKQRSFYVKWSKWKSKRDNYEKYSKEKTISTKKIDIISSINHDDTAWARYYYYTRLLQSLARRRTLVYLLILVVFYIITVVDFLLSFFYVSRILVHILRFQIRFMEVFWRALGTFIAQYIIRTLVIIFCSFSRTGVRMTRNAKVRVLLSCIVGSGYIIINTWYRSDKRFLIFTFWVKRPLLRELPNGGDGWLGR